MKHRPRVVLSCVLACGGLAAFSPATAAPTAQSYVVDVLPGVDPALAASRVNVTPTYVYRAGFNGYAAMLTSAQRTAVAHDAATASVQLDAVRTLPAEAMTVLPEQPPQFVTSGIRRIGGKASPTAHIDGVDERIDVDVAVIDDGVDAMHPDLNVAGVVNCVNPSKSTVDPGQHGTLVSGFVGALDNGFGAVGVAPGARIWGIQAGVVSGQLTESRILCALDWVAAHSDVIDVVNMSYGGVLSKTDTCTSLDRPGARVGQRDLEHEALCTLDRAGVTLVAAAGNEATDRPLYPAAFPEVIGVSAIGDRDGLPGGLADDVTCGGISAGQQHDDHLAFFSNFGSNADIAAPGVCISSTFPGGLYATGSGTSFASPLVAGAAALYLHNHPDASPAQVRAALLSTQEPGPIPGDVDSFREGVLNVATL